jgi:hypothetical protein
MEEEVGTFLDGLTRRNKMALITFAGTVQISQPFG